MHGEAILRYLGRRFGMLGTWGRRVGGWKGGCGVDRGDSGVLISLAVYTYAKSPTPPI